MRFRHPVLFGFAVGYVAGARAGRTRYEQMRRAGTKAISFGAQRFGREAPFEIDQVTEEPYREPFADPRYTPGT